jgi:GMP synthase (glutamine-hydrolysing)
MARALGGEVQTDLDSAEVGTYTLTLTDAGRADPVFSILGDTFPAQMGHEDLVTKLPEGAVCLASSERTVNQGWTIPGKPIYCTQFHPELSLSQLLDRLRHYPKYIRKITGMEYEQFVEECCRETNETDGLLKRFVEVVVER